MDPTAVPALELTVETTAVSTMTPLAGQGSTTVVNADWALVFLTLVLGIGTFWYAWVPDIDFLPVAASVSRLAGRAAGEVLCDALHCQRLR